MHGSKWKEMTFFFHITKYHAEYVNISIARPITYSFTWPFLSKNEMLQFEMNGTWPILFRCHFRQCWYLFCTAHQAGFAWPFRLFIPKHFSYHETSKLIMTNDQSNIWSIWVRFWLQCSKMQTVTHEVPCYLIFSK